MSIQRDASTRWTSTLGLEKGRERALALSALGAVILIHLKGSATTMQGDASTRAVALK